MNESRRTLQLCCDRGTYVEPFALRALGAARGDQALIDDAIPLSSGWPSIGTRPRRAK